MGQSATVTIWVEDLREGVSCHHNINDEDGRLLLGEGTLITSALIEGLIERGIETIEVNRDDAKTWRQHKPVQRSVKSSRGDDPAPVVGNRAKWATGVPLKDLLVDRFHEPINPERSRMLAEGFAAAKTQIQSLRSSLSVSKLKTVAAMDEVSERFARCLVDDHDQTLTSLVAKETNIDLADRSVQMSVIAMSVGVEMGLDGISVCELGTSGLVHDLGLYQMNPKFMRPGASLTDEERWQYQKHPIVTRQCLADIQELPHPVRIAVEQVHEQFDGTGYPRGLQGKRIHPYARILNVVDAYLELIHPTQKRGGIVPHDAMGILLHRARYGLFEPAAIRALLACESLFPLGSHVELSNGLRGQVIRRHPDDYAHPVIQDSDGNRIELDDRNVYIKRPVAAEESQQIRVTRECMEVMQWHPGEEVTLDFQ